MLLYFSFWSQKMKKEKNEIKVYLRILVFKKIIFSYLFIFISFGSENWFYYCFLYFIYSTKHSFYYHFFYDSFKLKFSHPNANFLYFIVSRGGLWIVLFTYLEMVTFSFFTTTKIKFLKERKMNKKKIWVKGIWNTITKVWFT